MSVPRSWRIGIRWPFVREHALVARAGSGRLAAPDARNASMMLSQCRSASAVFASAASGRPRLRIISGTVVTTFLMAELARASIIGRVYSSASRSLSFRRGVAQRLQRGLRQLAVRSHLRGPERFPPGNGRQVVVGEHGAAGCVTRRRSQIRDRPRAGLRIRILRYVLD